MVVYISYNSLVHGKVYFYWSNQLSMALGGSDSVKCTENIQVHTITIQVHYKKVKAVHFYSSLNIFAGVLAYIFFSSQICFCFLYRLNFEGN